MNPDRVLFYAAGQNRFMRFCPVFYVFNRAVAQDFNPTLAKIVSASIYVIKQPLRNLSDRINKQPRIRQHTILQNVQQQH